MDNFDAHKWFKKQYLGEGHTNDDDIVAKGDGIEITKKQMERLQKGYSVRLSNGSVLASPFVKEGMSDKEFRDAQEADALEKHPEKDKIKAIQAMMVKEKPLKENMSPGEAVVELNYYMDKLQEISGDVSRIMEQYFPDEFNQGDAYGAFDFGSSRNQYDTTFESILDDLASVGDDME
jgi:hypothetical protein